MPGRSHLIQCDRIFPELNLLPAAVFVVIVVIIIEHRRAAIVAHAPKSSLASR